ncbi:TIGR02253 family HAD-type hydrolase [Candidatus Woesearchaeota archaeon]|nr:TIGR02253 family HAD-type hydrolase [Candidatus Woesearchaeota archaeon]
MIKAILFDLDNTLIDFMKMKHIAISEAIDAMIDAGLTIPKEDALEILYQLYHQTHFENPQIFQRFLKKVTGEIDYKKLAYAIVAYRQARTGFLHPYPGTKKTLIALKSKGLQLAIVSDAPKLKAWLRLVAMRIDDFFDVVVALEDTGRTKPSILPFKAALTKLKVKPEECLMVGDRPSRDMAGARKLGIKTCFAQYGSDKQVRNIKTDHAIASIDELITIVEKENSKRRE